MYLPAYGARSLWSALELLEKKVKEKKDARKNDDSDEGTPGSLLDG